MAAINRVIQPELVTVLEHRVTNGLRAGLFKWLFHFRARCYQPLSEVGKMRLLTHPPELPSE